MTSTLQIGIDIGWSEKKRSSAVAAYDPLNLIKWPIRAATYSDGLSSSCFRFSEVLEFLLEVQSASAKYDRIVTVFDGPIGPNGRPRKNRYVDGAFRRGEFNRRMQPADVSTDKGHVYVDATYETIQSLVPNFKPWLGGAQTQRAVVAETNPTVGLALINRKYVPDELPARSRPLVPPTGNRSSKAIRAKSDFYWRTCGAFFCSELLESESIAAELDHERVASLYCLAVAKSITTNNYCSCGRMTDGVYLFPAEIHPDWKVDVQSVGVVAGQLRAKLHDGKAMDFSKWKFAMKAASTTKNDDRKTAYKLADELENELACKGDNDYLLLNDNGGVWEAHNDWLSDMEAPVRAVSLTNGEKLELKRAQGDGGQWCCKPPPNKLAASHGLDVSHLSKKNCVSIPIKVDD